MSDVSEAFARSRIALIKTFAERYKAATPGELGKVSDEQMEVINDADWLFYTSDDGFGCASWELDGKRDNEPEHFRPEFGFDSDRHASFDVTVIQTRGGDLVSFKVAHHDIPAELVQKRFLRDVNAQDEYIELTEDETAAFKVFMGFLLPDD